MARTCSTATMPQLSTVPLQVAFCGLLLLAMRGATLPTTSSPVTYTRIDVNGITLSMAVAGSGVTPMVLLHVFPECSWFWCWHD